MFSRLQLSFWRLTTWTQDFFSPRVFKYSHKLSENDNINVGILRRSNWNETHERLQHRTCLRIACRVLPLKYLISRKPFQKNFVSYRRRFSTGFVDRSRSCIRTYISDEYQSLEFRMVQPAVIVKSRICSTDRRHSWNHIFPVQTISSRSRPRLSF